MLAGLQRSQALFKRPQLLSSRQLSSFPVVAQKEKPASLHSCLLKALSQKQPAVMQLDKRIGFLGAGQMAEALARGFLSKGVVTDINVCDPSPERKELFRAFGCTPHSSIAEVE